MNKFKVLRRGCAEEVTEINADYVTVSEEIAYFTKDAALNKPPAEVRIIAKETWTDIILVEETDE